MKRTGDIKGLRVISIEDGCEVGKVEDVIINAKKGAIDYVIVNCGEQILGGKVIASENVIGIGEYALTIENEEAIEDISRAPEAIALRQNNVLVVSTNVLTKKGRLIGESGDIFVDEDNLCQIVGLEFSFHHTPDETSIIPRKKVLTFGKKLIIVDDDVESFLIPVSEYVEAGDEMDLKSETSLPKEEGVVSLNSEQSEVNSEQSEVNLEEEEVDSQVFVESHHETLQENVAQQTQTDKPNDKELDSSQEVVEEQSSTDVFGQDVITKSQSKAVKESATGSAALFEQRQRQYLRGKVVTKSITDKKGKLLITEGSVIDDIVIDLAKNNGKLIELVMNNKVD